MNLVGRVVGLSPTYDMHCSEIDEATRRSLDTQGRLQSRFHFAASIAARLLILVMFGMQKEFGCHPRFKGYPVVASARVDDNFDI